MWVKANNSRNQININNSKTKNRINLDIKISLTDLQSQETTLTKVTGHHCLFRIAPKPAFNNTILLKRMLNQLTTKMINLNLQ